MTTATRRRPARLALATAAAVVAGALGVLPAAPAGAAPAAGTTASFGTPTGAGRPIAVEGTGFEKAPPGVDVSVREYDEGDPAYAGGPVWADGPTASASIQDDGTFETSLLLTPAMLAALDPSKKYSVVTRAADGMGTLPAHAHQITETPLDVSQVKGVTTVVAFGGTSYRGSTTIDVQVIGYRGHATGAVTVKEGGATVGTGVLTESVVQIPLDLPAGTHDLTFEYPGDSEYWPSTGHATEEVRKQGVDMRMTTPTKASYGSVHQVTVSVPGATGQVTLKGAGSTRTGTLQAGKVTFTYPASLAAGSYPLTATYGGDADFETEQATGELFLTRAATRTRVAVTSKPTTKKAGKAAVTGRPRAKITVSVTRGKAQTPVMRVTIRLNSKGKGVVKLPKAPKGGTFELGAIFNGEANYDLSSGWAHYTVKT